MKINWYIKVAVVTLVASWAILGAAIIWRAEHPAPYVQDRD